MPEIGIVYLQWQPEHEAADAEVPDTLLVYIINASEGGLLLESLQKFGTGSMIELRLRLPQEKTWQAFNARVVWAEDNPAKENCYLLGVDFEKTAPYKRAPVQVEQRRKRMLPCDLEFLVHIPLFAAIAVETKCPLLNCMKPERVQAGERFIVQGDEGGSFSIIQEGSGVVTVEKDGKSYPVARLRLGDIVGEMAILTGEQRNAHVEAESEMNWTSC